jgi:hypothetical protein
MNEEFKSNLEPLMKKTRKILKRHSELMRTDPIYRLYHIFHMGWQATELRLIMSGHSETQIELFRRIAWKKFVNDYQDELKKLDETKDEAE